MSLPRGAIADLVRGLTNKTPTIWEGEPEPFLAVKNGQPGKYYKLDLGTYRAKGTDDYRQVDNPVTGARSSSLNGYRICTITVQAFSFDAKVTGHDMLDSLRTRLRSVSAKTICRNEGFALVDFPGAVTPLRVTADTRPIFAATMDVRLAFASVEDALDDAGTTILTTSLIVGKPT